MAGDIVTTGAILGRTAALLRDGIVPLVTAVAGLTALGLAMDYLIGESGTLATIASLMASVAAQLFITHRLLKSTGVAVGVIENKAFPALLGLVLLSGIATFAGLALLIVPGMILAVRWAIAVPLLVGERAGVIQALRESWRQTKGHGWPILGALLVVFLPAYLLVSGLFYAAYPDSPSEALTIAAGILITTTSVIGWYLAVAIHGLIRRPAAEIFA